MKILFLRLLLIFPVICSPFAVCAEDAGDDSRPGVTRDIESYSEDEVLPFDEEPSTLKFLDSPHSVVSGGVETVAKYMDIFFADEKIYQEATKSYAILSGQAIIDEYGENTYAGDLRIKIDLPKTKKKLKLVLESDTEQELQSGVDRDGQESPAKAASEADYYAALQRELKKHHEWKFFSSLGMKLNVPIDPFYRLRASRHITFAKWNMHFSETLFWFDSLGAGAATLLELDRKIGDSLLFRSTSSAIWRDDTDAYELSQSLSLFHEITKQRAISFSITANGVSDPTVHSTSYLANIRYRQRIHKDWLYFEIRPEFLYERENKFHASPSLVLQLDMIFGEKYSRKITPEEEEDD